MNGKSFRINRKYKRENSMKYDLESIDKKKKISNGNVWNILPRMNKTEFEEAINVTTKKTK